MNSYGMGYWFCMTTKKGGDENMDDIKNKLYAKLIKWIDGEENKTIYPIVQEDDGQWHRMIFVISYPNGADITVRIIRVFTTDGVEISLSEDFKKNYPFKDINSIPDAINDVCKILEKVR